MDLPRTDDRSGDASSSQDVADLDQTIGTSCSDDVADFDLLDIAVEHVSTVQRTIDFLFSLKLLPPERKCPHCAAKMCLVTKAALTDGMVWACHPCRSKQVSICQGTLFERTHVVLSACVALLHMFCEDTPAYIAHRLLKKHVSYKKTVSWYEEFRKVCSQQLLREPMRFERDGVTISTKNLEVEVDESWFGKK